MVNAARRTELFFFSFETFRSFMTRDPPTTMFRGDTTEYVGELFKDIKGHLRGLVAGTLTSKKAFHFETKTTGRSVSVWGFSSNCPGRK